MNELHITMHVAHFSGQIDGLWAAHFSGQIDGLWPADTRGGLSLICLFDFFQLWDILQETILT
jgi:hypothetical protein